MAGLSAGRDEPAAFVRPQVVRVSLWAVLGLWLARRLARLVLLIVRSPAAMAGILLTTAFWPAWQLVHPALPLGVARRPAWPGWWCGGSAGRPRSTLSPGPGPQLVAGVWVYRRRGRPRWTPSA